MVMGLIKYVQMALRTQPTEIHTTHIILKQEHHGVALHMAIHLMDTHITQAVGVKIGLMAIMEDMAVDIVGVLGIKISK